MRMDGGESRRKETLKRCWRCGAMRRKVYVRISRRQKNTFIAVGWLCSQCGTFSYELERLRWLASSHKRKPKKRCLCGAPMLRIYIRPQKSQTLRSIGWICLRNYTPLFDETNLNRQFLCSSDSIGSSKAGQAQKRVGQINPAVDFIPVAKSLEQTKPITLSRCSVVFDCLDNVPSRRELIRRCSKAGATLIHGAIAGWSGQIGVCPPGSDLLERLLGAKDRGSEQDLGNLVCTAAAAANFMVALAMPILMGQAEAQEKFYIFDLLDPTFQEVSF